MSVTSSPEPMELETAPPPSLLTGDVAADWPISEDSEMVLSQYSYSHSDFSEQMQADRDQTRTKILSLSSGDPLTIGENIRAHPSHSEDILFSQTTPIKPKNPTSFPLLASPRHPFSSVPTQHTKDTPPHTEPTENAKINSVHRNRFFLNSTCDPCQHHSNLESEQNSEISPTHSNTDRASPTPTQDLKNLNNSVGESDSDSIRAGSLEIVQPETPAYCSPVITNGAEHEDVPPQLKSAFKPHSLDTPPLSSTTPEDPVSDTFSSLSSDTQPNGSTLQTSSNPQERDESEDKEEAASLKLSRAEDTQGEIENKDPNYELETPPDDVTDLLLATSRSEDQTQQSSPSEFHDCEQGILIDESTVLQQDIDYSSVDLLTPTLLTEIETFCTVPTDTLREDEVERDHTPLHATHIPPCLKDSVYSPSVKVTTRSHLKKCEDIICMQRTLQEKSRDLKRIIAQIEEGILIEQSRTFISVTQDRGPSNSYRVPAHTHSHLLMQTHTRESEKQARSFKATLMNCRDRINTGFETESSSEDECYLNSTNLGGPKRRRLTKLHRSWLSDRAEIGGRWNWLDLQIGQIESGLSSVNQRLEELRCYRLGEHVSLDTSSRCTPYSPSPSSSRVIHQSALLRLRTLSNILQSTPHYHSTLSLPDDIPSTLLMYDSTMRLSTKDLPLDPKDLRKLELAISHNRAIPNMQGGRYRAIKGNNRKIGHRPKLNNSQDQNLKHRYGSISIAELSHHKPGKSKPMLSGSRQRRARSYDTTSIVIPGSYLPKPEKHSLKEIVIPGWRRVEHSQLDPEAANLEDTTDSSYEAMHAKCEELEIRNYQDALHCHSASSKKLKRLQIYSDTQKLSAAYGWSFRRFPLSSDDWLEEFTNHSEISKPTDFNSPIEDSVFSAPHVTSLSFKSQQ